MVMQTMQIRLTKGLIEEISKLVARGIYPSTSEAVRDAVRRLITGTSEMKVPEKEVKEVQEKVAKEVEEQITKQFKKPTGTVDFFPEDMAIRNKVFNSLRNSSERFGFKEIEVPAFEDMRLLRKKAGDEVNTQIFVLEKRAQESFGLRFELTASFARMFVEKQKAMPKPVKWFGLSRMWRYERPQAGRLREFYQLSVEVFGSDKPEADAEVINLAINCFTDLGLNENDFFVKVNNRKLLQGLLLNVTNKDKLDGVLRIIDKSKKISREEFDKELKDIGVNPDKVNEIMNCETLANSERLIKNDLAKEGYNELKLVLDKFDDRFVKFDISVARGLAYYTGTVFEVFDKDEKLRALAGGGRYDKLIENYGGQPCPATGFAIGYATLSLLLEQKNLVPTIDIAPDYYVVVIGDAADKANEIVGKLRKNYKVEIDIMRRNVGNQLKYANSIGAKKVMFIGPDELAKGIVKVKDMSSGKQEEVKIEEL
ncbi:histidine--tRNA ligase [Candidatus Woesearchaeota archaeon]|nr:histidine--tRNA ligase [Candidatus Woesearchaeota archaeon]